MDHSGATLEDFRNGLVICRHKTKEGFLLHHEWSGGMPFDILSPPGFDTNEAEARVGFYQDLATNFRTKRRCDEEEAPVPPAVMEGIRKIKELSTLSRESFLRYEVRNTSLR